MRRDDAATLTLETPEGRQQIALVADVESQQMRTAAGRPIDGARFVSLRERQSAVILADDPVLVRRLLHLPADETGIVERVLKFER